MIVVVSQAWTLDETEHAEAYIRLSAEFLEFLQQQPGFRGRRLLRGVEDRTHFTNLRCFASLPDYEALIQRPGYAERINALGTHLKPYDSYPREFMEVILDDEAA
jgi:heme-degrading monooxygenase HmoA